MNEINDLEEKRRKAREGMRRYRAANPEKVRANARRTMKAWRQRNPERTKEIAKKSYEKHRVAANARTRKYHAQWYVENREEKLAANKAWYAAHPGLVNAKTGKRRAGLKHATPKWLTKEQHAEMQNIYVVANLVHMEVDHRVPLRGENVCGLHVPWNLQLLTRELNQAKGNQL